MFGFEGAGKVSKKIPVAMRLWETPVPIPNTTVKTQTADDTWLETARESKWLPGYKKELKRKVSRSCNATAINLAVYPLAKRAANKR